MSTFAFPGSKTTMAGEAGCETGRWERRPFEGCADGAKRFLSWFAVLRKWGVMQVIKKCKLSGISRDNRMFLIHDSVFVGGNGRMMFGCAW